MVGSRRGRAARTASADRSSNGHPAGAVVDPLRVLDVGRIESHGVDHLGDEVRFDRSAANERRRREREPVAVVAHRDQSGAALLDGRRRAASSTPPLARHAQHVPSVGMPGERELAERRPDPDAVVGGVARRRQRRMSSPTGSSTARSSPSPRRRSRRRRARRRADCRGTATCRTRRPERNVETSADCGPRRPARSTQFVAVDLVFKGFSMVLHGFLKAAGPKVRSPVN